RESVVRGTKRRGSHGLQSLLAHQPPHPMPPDDDIIAHLGGAPPCSIAARMLPEDLLYSRRELILACGTLFPGVIPAATHSEQAAQNRGWISDGLAPDEAIWFCHVG